MDHSANRHLPKVKVFVLDVSNSNQLMLLETMLHHCKPCHVHLGLPCGTCSRAREKPMPSKLGGHMGPQPLRSAEHLRGFPHLTGADKIKVDLANQLYNSAIRILQICMVLGCLVSIENPARSWLWALLAVLVKDTNDQLFISWFANLESIYFDACAHGSLRDKRTKLLATQGVFTSLAADCPQSHVHASWQPYKSDQGVIFPTAAEAEYPSTLCKRMADCVLEASVQMGVQPTPSLRLKDLLRLGLGQQSIRHPPLVPEYKEFIHLSDISKHPAHKLLAAPPHHGETNTEQQLDPEAGAVKRPRTTFKYGVWHEPEEFLKKAQEAKHPIDQDSFLHQITKDAIVQVVGTCPTKLAKERLSTVFHVKKLSTDLKLHEKELKASLHPDVSRCVNSKNILLFEKLLQQLNYWDMGVVDLLKFGVPLVGLQEPPTGYQRLLVPASMTEDELMASARWRRTSIMQTARPLSKSEEDALVEATASEVEKGFLQGPYSEAEMSVLMGTECWSLNPRFVLFQGANQKVRVIDDAKQSAVNSAYSSTVKLQLQDVDYAAAMVLGAMREAGLSGSEALEWLGKTFDLSRAYKQLAVLPDHQLHAIVGFPLGGKWQFYKSVSLPFGCTGSVYGFVRISQALWFLLSKLLKAITSHYFDDFPTVERSDGCRVLTLAFSALLDLLGWDHAKEGDKALNFSATFDLLGVTFDLSGMSLGALVVRNKTSRIEKLCAMLDQVAKDKNISAAKASELQGLLNFAVSFYLGRSMKHLVSAFMPFADKPQNLRASDLESLCLYTKTMLLEQRPRVHSVLNVGRPVVVFTDGAWEDGIATAGAVLVDGDIRLAFQLEVPQALVDHWLANAGEQIISQVELWGLVLLKWSRRDHLQNRRVIEWIDNESARISSIKANSHSPTMRSLSRMLADLDLRYPAFPWTERVCSYSNPADLPSRNRLKEAMKRYCLDDGGVIKAPADLVNALIQFHRSPYMLLTTTGENH